MQAATIITCAVTGSLTRPEDNPNLPVTPEQIAGWEAILKRVSESDTWKELMAASSASNEYKNSAETKEFFAADYQRAKELMTELGMAK